MPGGIRIQRRFRGDMDKVVELLNKALDSIYTDNNKERTQKYLSKACEICKKYIN